MYNRASTSHLVPMAEADVRLSSIGATTPIMEKISESDDELILACRNGDAHAWERLLDKYERRQKEVKIDYLGFQIPDEFVVGYGLDFAERYRNLPFIGVLKNPDA